VSGEDAPGFLQGQFSNDVRQVGPGRGVYGLWLNEKGKVMADSFLVGSPADREFWVGSYCSAGDAIRGRLEAFIVADDVTVEDLTAEWTAVSLLGDGVAGWLASEPRPGVVFRGRRSSQESWEWVFPALLQAEVAARLADVPALGPDEMERRRIASGIPSVPSDIGQGDLPNEGRLEADAISTAKGCYVGQEVMARIKSRGVVRRRVVLVSGSGPAPGVPAGLWHEGRQVGQLRSAAPEPAGDGFTGLAMLPTRLLGQVQAFSMSASSDPVVRVVV
jgi:hypothetical protein